MIENKEDLITIKKYSLVHTIVVSIICILHMFLFIYSYIKELKELSGVTSVIAEELTKALTINLIHKILMMLAILYLLNTILFIIRGLTETSLEINNHLSKKKNRVYKSEDNINQEVK